MTPMSWKSPALLLAVILGGCGSSPPVSYYDLEALETGPEPLERIAREQLDYVGPGEITFLLPEDDRFPDSEDPERP